ncbi:MAG: hypothetical protein II794_07635 [Oscillospiraceae bacterium]|nr:hypothetical protein [Oscillospiraceae bacterium]
MSALFNKSIEPSCAYCKFGSRINSTQVACLKKGVVSAGGHCRRFSYDVLRRVPARPLELKTQGLEEKDFTLE